MLSPKPSTSVAADERPPAPASGGPSARQDLADEPVRLVGGAGAEPQGTRSAGRRRTGEQAPEAVDRDRFAVGRAELADEMVAPERSVAAVTEVADQQRPGEAAE